MWSAFARTGELELGEAPGTAIAAKARAAAARKIARCTALSVASHIDLAISEDWGSVTTGSRRPVSGRLKTADRSGLVE